MGPIFAFRPPPSPAQIATTPIVAPDVSYHVSADTEATGSVDHLHVYEWYIHTIQNPTQYHDGFYYSPLLGNSWSSGGGGGATLQAGVGFAPTLQLQSANKAGGGAIPASLAVTGFSTFGNVGASNNVYTLTEQGNTGIYQTLTIPMNATVLKFRVQFTQAGDGDFVGVYFGDFLPLALIGDGEVMRDEPVDFEIPVSQFGGETAQLLFKLSGVGADNAVVRIDGITIETDDDADHDGLTFAQETALGTDPRYFDTDGDGLSDAYEVNVSHTNPVLADSDGDGQNDAAEIAAGTDPLDSHSVFAVTEFARAGGGFLLRWSAVAGKTYRILRSGTVDFASFDVIVSGIAGIAPVTTYNDTRISTVTTTQAFYRIEAE